MYCLVVSTGVNNVAVGPITSSFCDSSTQVYVVDMCHSCSDTGIAKYQTDTIP